MEAFTIAAGGLLAGLWILYREDLTNRPTINHSLSTFPTLEIPNLKAKSTKLRVRIIVPSGSLGTDFDAQVYQKLIQGSIVVYVDPSSPQTHPSRYEFFDVNFYVERIIGDHELFPSRFRWLMPNQEMMRIREPLHSIDTFICKTKYAKNLVSAYLPTKSVIYSAHTSKDLLDGFFPTRKDYNLVVHFAGKSWLKNTRKVIKTWIMLKPEKTLVVTCREHCLSDNKLKQILTSNFELSHKGNEIWSKGNSKIIVARHLSDADLRKLQLRAGYYLCPSEVEGYGHYINEGRSAMAVVITTNFPPMNELINRECGFLVPVEKSYSEGELPGSMKAYITKKNLYSTLEKAFSCSEAKLEDMGKTSRKMYLRDQHILESSLKVLVQNFSSLVNT